MRAVMRVKRRRVDTFSATFETNGAALGVFVDFVIGIDLQMPRLELQREPKRPGCAKLAASVPTSSGILVEYLSTACFQNLIRKSRVIGTCA